MLHLGCKKQEDDSCHCLIGIHGLDRIVSSDESDSQQCEIITVDPGFGEQHKAIKNDNAPQAHYAHPFLGSWPLFSPSQSRSPVHGHVPARRTTSHLLELQSQPYVGDITSPLSTPENQGTSFDDVTSDAESHTTLSFTDSTTSIDLNIRHGTRCGLRSPISVVDELQSCPVSSCGPASSPRSASCDSSPITKPTVYPEPYSCGTPSFQPVPPENWRSEHSFGIDVYVAVCLLLSLVLFLALPTLRNCTGLPWSWPSPTSTVTATHLTPPVTTISTEMVTWSAPRWRYPAWVQLYVSHEYHPLDGIVEDLFQNDAFTSSLYSIPASQHAVASPLGVKLQSLLYFLMPITLLKGLQLSTWFPLLMDVVSQHSAQRFIHPNLFSTAQRHLHLLVSSSLSSATRTPPQLFHNQLPLEINLLHTVHVRKLPEPAPTHFTEREQAQCQTNPRHDNLSTCPVRLTDVTVPSKISPEPLTTKTIEKYTCPSITNVTESLSEFSSNDHAHTKTPTQRRNTHTTSLPLIEDSSQFIAKPETRMGIPTIVLVLVLVICNELAMLYTISTQI